MPASSSSGAGPINWDHLFDGGGGGPRNDPAPGMAMPGGLGLADVHAAQQSSINWNNVGAAAGGSAPYTSGIAPDQSGGQTFAGGAALRPIPGHEHAWRPELADVRRRSRVPTSASVSARWATVSLPSPAPTISSRCSKVAVAAGSAAAAPRARPSAATPGRSAATSSTTSRTRTRPRTRPVRLPKRSPSRPGPGLPRRWQSRRSLRLMRVRRRSPASTSVSRAMPWPRVRARIRATSRRCPTCRNCSATRRTSSRRSNRPSTGATSCPRRTTTSTFQGNGGTAGPSPYDQPSLEQFQKGQTEASRPPDKVDTSMPGRKEALRHAQEGTGRPVGLHMTSSYGAQIIQLSQVIPDRRIPEALAFDTRAHTPAAGRRGNGQDTRDDERPGNGGGQGL